MPDYVLIKEILKPDTEGGYIINDGDKAETYYEVVAEGAEKLPNPIISIDLSGKSEQDIETILKPHRSLGVQFLDSRAFVKKNSIVTVTRTGNPYEFEEGKYFIVHRDDINGYFE